MRDWLSHRVAASSEHTALVRAADGESWTYSGLDRLVAETAGRLSSLGVEPGDHLGVVMPPCAGYVGLIHAAMRLGATLVPIGDDLTVRELTERVDRADVTTLVCSTETEPKAAACAAETDVPVVSVDEPDTADTGLHEHTPESVEPVEWDLDDRLCLLFTSGTTGTPKAVQITLGNILASAVTSAFRLGLDPSDRWLVTLSLHHMGGLAPVYRSVLYGTTVVLREEFGPGSTADDIDTYGVTGVSLVPTMLSRMLDSRGTLSDTLRAVLLGGAPASDDLIERCRDYSIPVYPTYGMTETASQIATADPNDTRRSPGTVGKPLFWTDVKVVNSEGDPVPRGTTGEFVVDGPTVTPGYYEDPDATAAAFSSHGLHTGDIGYVDDDGFLYVLNRADDRILSGGENVDPGEVTDVLSEHPAVADVAVVGTPDETWGEVVSALVVPAGEEPPDATDLLRFARERLAGFKLPRRIAFVEAIPRTVSGTADREAVRTTLQEEGFEPERPDEEFDTAGFEPADPVPDTDGDDDSEVEQPLDQESDS